MKLEKRLDKFINSKPTKFEKIFAYVFAACAGVFAVVVLVLLVLHGVHVDLF